MGIFRNRFSRQLRSEMKRAKRELLPIMEESSYLAAKALLGYDLVSIVDGQVRRVRIIKTRSFQGQTNNTRNVESMLQEAGKVFLMKARASTLFLLTCEQEGVPSCVWIEETKDVRTGEVVRSKRLLERLALQDSDRLPIFSDSTGIVFGQSPSKIREISPDAAGASENTTGIFKASFSGQAAKAGAEAVSLDALISACESYISW